MIELTQHLCKPYKRVERYLALLTELEYHVKTNHKDFSHIGKDFFVLKIWAKLYVLAGTRGLRPLIAKNPHHLEPASPYNNKSHRNLKFDRSKFYL